MQVTADAAGSIVWNKKQKFYKQKNHLDTKFTYTHNLVQPIKTCLIKSKHSQKKMPRSLYVSYIYKIRFQLFSVIPSTILFFFHFFFVYALYNMKIFCRFHIPFPFLWLHFFYSMPKFFFSSCNIPYFRVAVCGCHIKRNGIKQTLEPYDVYKTVGIRSRSVLYTDGYVQMVRVCSFIIYIFSVVDINFENCRPVYPLSDYPRVGI